MWPHLPSAILKDDINSWLCLWNLFGITHLQSEGQKSQDCSFYLTSMVHFQKTLPAHTRKISAIPNTFFKLVSFFWGKKSLLAYSEKAWQNMTLRLSVSSVQLMYFYRWQTTRLISLMRYAFHQISWRLSMEDVPQSSGTHWLKKMEIFIHT